MNDSAGTDSMSKSFFLPLFKVAWDKAFTESNIQSAFRKAGIWPTDGIHIITAIARPVISSLQNLLAFSKLHDLQNQFVISVYRTKRSQQKRKLRLSLLPPLSYLLRSLFFNTKTRACLRQLICKRRRIRRVFS